MALAGSLPPRYETDFWKAPFEAELGAALRPGLRILDVGAGAQPALAPERRPRGCHYTAIDVSRSELDRAPPGSYDATVVADVTARIPKLERQFDLVISWLAFEHVKPLDVALDNMHAYLRPGGRLIAYVPGAFSLFAVVNRAIPHRVALPLLRRLFDRDPQSIFPAHYHRCSYTGLARSLDGRWESWDVRPLHTGARYLGFSRLLTAAYIGYEEWAWRGGHRNLAAYYLVVGRA